jgi:hypothetical protein
LKFSVRELIPIFKLAVVRAPVLYRVIGQVNQPVLDILDVVLSARGPKVSVLVKVSAQVAVDCCGQRVESNIEFALLIQQGPFAILLDDVRPLFSVDNRVLDDLLNLCHFSADRDAAASVRVLAWLNDPQLPAHRRMLL